MKLRFHRRGFIPHPSSFIHFGRRSQVVRQRSAKPLFIGSIPIAASKTCSTIASQKPKLPTSWLFHAYVCCRTDSMRFQW